MSSGSQNTSSRSLMGFSVHQPAIGAALQFFPAMGSQELDEMIDAYVPGTSSILDKRALVSMEFFEHSLTTGELFKFFMVNQSHASMETSPAASMMDSGYGSSSNTSPILSESQWAQMSSSSYTPSTSKVAKKAALQAGDFSHIPGMKIMTKDGQDVTNSASRGCKTKEQRDHAHLMRVIKACDACRRKKTRCDPSHKKRGSSASSSPEPRVSKKVKKTASQPIQQAPSFETEIDISFAATDSSTATSFEAGFETLAETADVEWDRFFNYEQGITNTVANDYDFFYDPSGYFSPTTSDSNSATVSPSQILTPGVDQSASPEGVSRDGSDVNYNSYDLEGLRYQDEATLPYLTSNSANAGGNYIDFALYSPGSSCLDDDPTFYNEVAAPRAHVSSQRERHSSRGGSDSRVALSEGLTSPTQGDQSLSDPQSCSQSTGFDQDHLVRSSRGNGLSTQQERILLSDTQDGDHGIDQRQYSRRRPATQSPAAGSCVAASAGPDESWVPTTTRPQRDPDGTGRPQQSPQLSAPDSGNRQIAGALELSVRKSSRCAIATASPDERATALMQSPMERSTAIATLAPMTSLIRTVNAPAPLASDTMYPPGVEQRLLTSPHRQRVATDIDHTTTSGIPASSVTAFSDGALFGAAEHTNSDLRKPARIRLDTSEQHKIHAHPSIPAHSSSLQDLASSTLDPRFVSLEISAAFATIVASGAKSSQLLAFTSEPSSVAIGLAIVSMLAWCFVSQQLSELSNRTPHRSLHLALLTTVAVVVVGQILVNLTAFGGQALVSAMFIALSLVAVQQYPALGSKKSHSLEGALGPLRRLSSDAVEHSKSSVRDFQERIRDLSSTASTSLGRRGTAMARRCLSN